jgi:response regulator RpfG family c-di-GMP phosphodiesterase
MQDERKKELAKRRKVQDDYTNVVTQIFDVTLSSEKITEEEKKEADILAIMVKKLSSLLSLSPEKCDEVVNYSRLHIDKKVDFSFQNIQSDEEKFLAIREQTELGSKLISRLQLKRKGEDILRATFEGSDDDTFIRHEREIQNELESEIILICDLYVSMRSVKPYKKAYNHKNTIAYMEKSFKIYFDPMVYDRFTRYSSDFEKIFDEM